MNKEIFVDTSAWIALSDVRDKFHPRAKAYYPQLFKSYSTFVTTNFVIAETYTIIRYAGGSQPAFKFLDSIRNSNRITKVYATESYELKAELLLRRYYDQSFSFTDVVSFIVMQERSIPEAFSFDNHFKIAGFHPLPEA